MLNKKSSAVLMVFIIMLALAIFFMMNNQLNTDLQRTREEDTAQNYRSYLGSYGELMKKYSIHALRDASIKAVFKAGKQGVSNAYWRLSSCNNPADFKTTTAVLSDDTGYFFNNYVGTIEGYDFGKLQFNETGSIFEIAIWVDEPGVLAGDYDERFNISGKALMTYDPELYDKVIIKSFDDEQKRKFFHDYSTYVWPQRFWYLWRIIKQWVEEAAIPGQTCGILACGGCPKPENIVPPNVDNLESRFDEFVKCSYQISSCGKKCTIIPKGICGSPSPDPYCYASYGDDCMKIDKPEKGCPFSHGCTWGIPVYARVEFEYTVSCIDYKYKLPVEPMGYKHLLFRIREHVAMEVPEGRIPC